jgi:hypothetical protein
MCQERLPHEEKNGVSPIMTDPNVQRVREWLQCQPFSLRILTLILFTEEAVRDEFGEEVRKQFDGGLKEVYRKLPPSKEEAGRPN